MPARPLVPFLVPFFICQLLLISPAGNTVARADYAQEVFKDSPVAWWRFGDNMTTDGATAKDETGQPAGIHHGNTTAEQRHPKFALSYQGHECRWNGPSWPYSTTITLTAMANLLNNYQQDLVQRSDYFDLLKIYTKSHHLKCADGRVVPWIDENLNPTNGDWISRTRLLRLRKVKSCPFSGRRHVGPSVRPRSGGG